MAPPDLNIEKELVKEVEKVIDERTTLLDYEFQAKIKPVADIFFESITQTVKKYNSSMKHILLEQREKRDNLIKEFKHVPCSEYKIVEDLYIPDFSAKAITTNFEIYGYCYLVKYSDDEV